MRGARHRHTPYLELHHIKRLADDGLDHPDWVAAICPNCHRRIHSGMDGPEWNARLAEQVRAKAQTRFKDSERSKPVYTLRTLSTGNARCCSLCKMFRSSTTRSSPSLAKKIASTPEKPPLVMTTRSPALRYDSRIG